MKRLEVKKLEFAYGSNQILFEFDFSLEESQIGCLLGPSGCGKTTSLERSQVSRIRLKVKLS